MKNIEVLISTDQSEIVQSKPRRTTGIKWTLADQNRRIRAGEGLDTLFWGEEHLSEDDIKVKRLTGREPESNNKTGLLIKQTGFK